MAPLISICIPAFKRTDYLKRLLDSVTRQSFTDYEVIITDDSPGEEVETFIRNYRGIPQLRYQRNRVPLDTPENWNEAIRIASGSWIKLMHDDDWFAHAGSLQGFADAIQINPDAEFFFCAYRNVFENSGNSKDVFSTEAQRSAFQKNPAVLFANNRVGPPSVICHRNSSQFWYDKKIKWVVDIDFYMRYLAKHRAVYIPKILVNVGMHGEQVTATSFRVTEVEIPENFYLLNKIGTNCLRNLIVYDAWWRLMRNLHIQDIGQIRTAGYKGEVPKSIQSMLEWQKAVSPSMLQNGLFSKLWMLSNYIRNFWRLH